MFQATVIVRVKVARHNQRKELNAYLLELDQLVVRLLFRLKTVSNLPNLRCVILCTRLLERGAYWSKVTLIC